MAEQKRRRLLQTLLSGSKNIRFSEAVACAEAFGFRLSRTHGSHHIYVHAKVPELFDLPNVHGQAKPYQIKQLLIPASYPQRWSAQNWVRWSTELLKGRSRLTDF